MTSLWPRKLLGFALVGVLGAGIVGCAKSGTSSQQSTNTSTHQPPASASKAKLLRMTFSNAPLIDPGVGSDEAASAALANLYDTLVFPADDGSVKPHLATKWDVSQDGLTYTFELKSGVKFHNNDELTADDVVFTTQRVMKIGEGYGYLFANTVADVKALDKSKVQFVLKKPFGPFVPSLVRLYILNKKQVLANIAKSGSYGDMGDYGKTWLLTHDAGSGPYMVKEMKQTESLLAEKFKDYFLGFDPNNPDQFKMIGLTEAATVRTMMTRKELEITDQYQPVEAYAAFAKMPGISVASLPSANILYLALHNRKAPTDDIHVRRALAYLINYDAVTKTIFPDSKQSVGPVPAVLPGHNPNLPKFSYDPTKAQEELKQSKYYGQFDRYPIDVDYMAETPDREKLALMLQAEGSKVGLKINAVKVPWLSFVENVAKMDTTPTTATVAVAPHYAEAGSILESKFHSRSTGTWEQTEWIKSPEIDALIEDAITTTDRGARMQKYQKAQEKIMEGVLSIPLIDIAEKHAYQSDYVQWQAAENAKAGKPVNPVMGYVYYVRDMKVFPDKMK